MAKKKKKEQETTIQNYYDLRTDAVDDLVEALKTGKSDKEISTNIAEITGEATGARPGSKKAEFDPYRRDKLAGLPTWLKAIFIKWWFAGCVCYFVMMGLGSLIGDPSAATNENLFLITSIVLGVVVDVFVNPIFRYMESDRKEYNNYMMFPFPFKAFWTFFTNIIYYFGVMVLVLMSINGINALIDMWGWSTNVYFEPLLFGTLVTVIDMAFIGVKDLIVFLVRRAKRKKAQTIGEEGAEREDLPSAKAQAKESAAEAEKTADESSGEPIDEVEKLRRLAESKNAESAKGANSKNKKQK